MLAFRLLKSRTKVDLSRERTGLSKMKPAELLVFCCGMLSISLMTAVLFSKKSNKNKLSAGAAIPIAFLLNLLGIFKLSA